MRILNGNPKYLHTVKRILNYFLQVYEAVLNLNEMGEMHLVKLTPMTSFLH